MLDAGLNLAIGTDATNTSDGQNMFEALRLAAYLSRIADPDPARWLSGGCVPSGNRRQCGRARLSPSGSLDPGFAADIVFLDLRHINYVPLRAPLLQLVFAENGAAVESVMIGGRMVLDHGRLTTIDEQRLRDDAAAAATRLDAMNEAALRNARAIGALVGHFCLGHATDHFPLHRRLPDAAAR